MKRLVALVLALSAFAQSPGTITRTASTITATAGPVVCKFTHPKNAHVIGTCTVAGTKRRVDDMTPSAASQTAAVGSATEGVNSVAWNVQQPMPGVWTYEIQANGTRSTGTF